MRLLLPALLLCASLGCATSKPDSNIGKECLVLLRNDASLGGGSGDNSDDQSDSSDYIIPWFHGRLQSINDHWLVLRTTSGYDYYIPRESVLIAGVSRK